MPTGVYKRTKEMNEKMSQSMTGRVFTDEWKKNISRGKKGKSYNRPNYHHSNKTKLKIKNKMLGRKFSPEWLKKMSEAKKGEKSFKWIKDRSKVIDQSLRKTTQGRQWRRYCLIRDSKKCRINNKDCDGNLEVHHILSWREYPKLRYEVKNGITLCHKHHPIKESEEKRLSPYFQELISKE